jgi:hypothetical protein
MLDPLRNALEFSVMTSILVEILKLLASFTVNKVPNLYSKINKLSIGLEFFIGL